MAGQTLLTCLLFNILWSIVHSIEGNLTGWESRPVDLHQCEGYDVNFTWHYTSSPDNPIVMVYWLYLGNGKTIASWQLNQHSAESPVWIQNGQTSVYEGYEGRVSFLPEYNAGIRLDDVTMADAGQYKVELAGPGEVDLIQLTVYREAELVPDVYVNEVVWESGDPVISNVSDVTNITINTGANLPANITVSRENANQEDYLHTCIDETTCKYHLIPDTPGNQTIQIEVDYGFCRTHIVLITVEVYGDLPVSDEEPSSTNITIIACVTCVSFMVIVIVVIVAVWIARHKREKQDGEEEPLPEMAPLKQDHPNEGQLNRPEETINDMDTLDEVVESKSNISEASSAKEENTCDDADTPHDIAVSESNNNDPVESDTTAGDTTADENKNTGFLGWIKNKFQVTVLGVTEEKGE